MLLKDCDKDKNCLHLQFSEHLLSCPAVLGEVVLCMLEHHARNTAVYSKQTQNLIPQINFAHNNAHISHLKTARTQCTIYTAQKCISCNS